MKVEIDIDVDQIVIKDLKKTYSLLRREIMSLRSLESLRLYQIEDLENDQEVIKALRRVLKYYLSDNEFKEFLNVYGEE